MGKGHNIRQRKRRHVKYAVYNGQDEPGDKRVLIGSDNFYYSTKN